MPPSCALLGEFAIGARVALIWQHYGNAWQSPAAIRQAHRTPHACRTHGFTELSQRAPPVFGWAAITMGIGPQSSFLLANVHVRYMLSPVRLSSVCRLSVCRL